MYVCYYELFVWNSFILVFCDISVCRIWFRFEGICKRRAYHTENDGQATGQFMIVSRLFSSAVVIFTTGQTCILDGVHCRRVDKASGILRTCGPTNGYFADRKMRTHPHDLHTSAYVKLS